MYVVHHMCTQLFNYFGMLGGGGGGGDKSVNQIFHEICYVCFFVCFANQTYVLLHYVEGRFSKYYVCISS